jgi:hypothetical protein
VPRDFLITLYIIHNYSAFAVHFFLVSITFRDKFYEQQLHYNGIMSQKLGDSHLAGETLHSDPQGICGFESDRAFSKYLRFSLPNTVTPNLLISTPNYMNG